VADGNKRLLNVRNSEGVLVARSMIKLTKQRDEGDYERKTERPTMLVERPYGPSLSDVVVRAFAGTLFRKADEMGGVSVTLGKDFSADMMRVITEEAEKHGYRPREGTFQVHIPQSANAYEYSDSLGGEIRYFDTYHSYTGITFEKAPTRG